MVPVTIETLVVAILPSPSVVVLRPKQDNAVSKNVLPIWIGPTEAASIGIAIENQPRVRPMTHDFLATTIQALESSVERIVIDRVEGTLFYATVTLNRNGQAINLDARPSDALALAVRTNAPLFVDEDVLNSASYSYDFEREEATAAAVDEFRAFIDSISPEDFLPVE